MKETERVYNLVELLFCYLLSLEEKGEQEETADKSGPSIFCRSLFRVDLKLNLNAPYLMSLVAFPQPSTFIACEILPQTCISKKVNTQSHLCLGRRKVRVCYWFSICVFAGVSGL